MKYLNYESYNNYLKIMRSSFADTYPFGGKIPDWHQNISNKNVAKLIKKAIDNGYYSKLDFPRGSPVLIECKTKEDTLDGLQKLKYRDIPNIHPFWEGRKMDFKETNPITYKNALLFLSNKFRCYESYSQILEEFWDELKEFDKRQHKENK